MRNLKKILALVLALVMSLSLMATAGATDFQDAEDISEAYETAIEVLNGLEVFKGYDNGATFKPQGNITRAEVAAIIYRIATGDVTDAQKDIYSSWGLFTDVVDGSWYAGYVNYCANAGYIKGRGNKIFDPNGNVTGYEALAMILRAIGYDKNNEFSGTNWQVRTASIAKQRHITDNITDTLLGQAATREVVAEILFQSILVNEVEFQTSTLSYTEKNISLGKEVLDLDEVTGVVVANEYANLGANSEAVLAEGKTQMRVAAGDIRTLDLGTGLEDMGMSMFAYIQGSKVLAIADSGENTVWDNGVDGTADGQHVDGDVTTASTFSSRFGMSKDANTEYFVNFSHNFRNKADRRIEIRVTFGSAGSATGVLTGENGFDAYIGGDISKIAAKDSSYSVAAYNTTAKEQQKINVTTNAGGDKDYIFGTGYTYPVTYWKVFKLDDTVSADDLKVIKGIFGMADDNDHNLYVTGSVFVGSDSGSTAVTSSDKSDTMSYDAFKAEYIVEDDDQKWTSANDGEWVKVIDNDGDGVADYAFKTEFTLDKVVDTYKKSDVEYNRFYNLDLLGSNAPKARYMNDVAVGDIVLHTTIDKQALIWKADSVEDSVTNINNIYNRDVNIITASGETYKQSEIINSSRLDGLLNQMSETVNYRLYLDAFGRVRAYELVDGNKYALLTELYFGNYRNGMYVRDDILTAEYKAGDAAVAERVVSNKLNNPFVLNFTENVNGVRDTWTELNKALLGSIGYINGRYSVDVNTNDSVVESDHIILQPATQNLGFVQPTSMDQVFRNARTNIARYILNADGTISLRTAAQANLNATGTVANGYSVNYVNLAPTSVTAKKNVFTLRNADGSAYTPATTTDYSANVEATANTEFYIVNTVTGGIEHFTDWKNLPAVGGVDAMYAVARTANASNNVNRPYWVADVIVIESHDYQAQPDDFLIVLGRDSLWNTTQSASRQTANNGQSMLAFSAKVGDVVRVAPSSLNWAAYNYDRGFYKAYSVAQQENGLYTVGRLTPVLPNQVLTPNTESLNASSFQLCAGTVEAVSDLNNWLLVNMGNGSKQITYKGYALSATIDSLGRITTGNRIYGDNASNNVLKNHQIIWVQNSSNEALFVYDLTWSYNYSDKTVRDTATSLTQYMFGAWNQIYAEQGTSHSNTPSLKKLTIKGQDVVFSGNNGTVNLTYSVNADTTVDNYTYVLAGDTTAVVGVYKVAPDTGRPTVSYAKGDKPYNNGDKLEIVVQNATTTVVYYVTVKIETPSATSTLNQLWIKGQPVTLTAPVGSGNDTTVSATVTIPASANASNEPWVKAVPSDGRAKVEIIQSNSGALTGMSGDVTLTAADNYTYAITKSVAASGNVQVKVTADDGEHTTTYTVAVTAGTYTGKISVTATGTYAFSADVEAGIVPGKAYTINLVGTDNKYYASEVKVTSGNANLQWTSGSGTAVVTPTDGSNVTITATTKTLTEVNGTANGYYKGGGINGNGYVITPDVRTITFTTKTSSVTVTYYLDGVAQAAATVQPLGQPNNAGDYSYQLTWTAANVTKIDIA